MWIETAKQLPPEGKYVLARHNRGTWHDRKDQENVSCVVVKMERGISKEERQKMKEGALPDYEFGPVWCCSDGFTYPMRSEITTSADEAGNNTVPYCFVAFGVEHFNGKEITHWQPIEPLEMQ